MPYFVGVFTIGQVLSPRPSVGVSRGIAGHTNCLLRLKEWNIFKQNSIDDPAGCDHCYCCTIYAGRILYQLLYQYCGSLGVSAERAHILALEKFRVILTEKIENSTLDVRNSKVLLPNSMEDFGREFWIFPVAGARLAPFVLPVLPAFFYGYGDPSFSTTNYRDKVCKNFDRKWLKERGVRFVFLPGDRTRACISGMEDMISSEIVIISEKDSFVIELR